MNRLFRSFTKSVVPFLEFIPPSKLYRSLQLIAPLLQLSRTHPQEAAKQLKSSYKNELKLMSGYDLARILEASNCNIKIVNIVKATIFAHLQKYSFKELAEIVYQLALKNHHDSSFFRGVQLEIYERTIPFHIPSLYKFMWAFSHLGVGSAMTYTKICRVLEIGQHQTQEKDLLAFCYLISKVRDQTQRCSFLYKQLQSKLKMSLKRKDFKQLIRVAEVVFAQNICSSEIRQSLQQRLVDSFPSEPQQSQLVNLLRATTIYYFRFNGGSLLDVLQDRTKKLAVNLSLSGLQYTVWAWARSKRGGNQLWTVLGQCAIKQAGRMNQRGLAFTLNSLSRVSQSSQQSIESLQKCIIKRKIQNFNHHQLLKMISEGSQKRLSPSFIKEVVILLMQRIGELSVLQLGRFFGTMGDSQIDFTWQHKDELIQIFRREQRKLLQKAQQLSLQECGNLYFFMGKMEIKQSQLKDNIRRTLQQQYLSIPKAVFVRVLFSSILYEDISLSLKLLPIIYELQEYFDVPYFFRPREFPYLLYSLLQLKVNGARDRALISERLLESVLQIEKQLQRSVLNSYERKVVLECDKLISQMKKK